MNTRTILHCPILRPESCYRLICFPHAGGTASFFRPWNTAITDYEIYSVCYPGRSERIDEPLPTNLQQLAFEIAAAIESLALASLPIALFGHSMGAAVALETARALEAHNIHIAHLFASGSRHGLCPERTDLEEEDDDTVCQQLVGLGGTDPTIASDPIFRELVLPSVRSDGKMFHAYEMKPKPLLGCPVTTIFGNLDAHADVRPWRDLAPSGFNEHSVSGDHFYLISAPPFDILGKYLNQNHQIRDKVV